MKVGSGRFVHERGRNCSLLLRAQTACQTAENIRNESDALYEEIASSRKAKRKR
jgi:hypothetical protein